MGFQSAGASLRPRPQLRGTRRNLLARAPSCALRRRPTPPYAAPALPHTSPKPPRIWSNPHLVTPAMNLAEPTTCLIESAQDSLNTACDLVTEPAQSQGKTTPQGASKQAGLTLDARFLTTKAARPSTRATSSPPATHNAGRLEFSQLLGCHNCSSETPPTLSPPAQGANAMGCGARVCGTRSMQSPVDASRSWKTLRLGARWGADALQRTLVRSRNGPNSEGGGHAAQRPLARTRKPSMVWGRSRAALTSSRIDAEMPANRMWLTPPFGFARLSRHLPPGA